MENGNEENTDYYSLARSRTGPDGPELLQQNMIFSQACEEELKINDAVWGMLQINLNREMLNIFFG